MYRLEHMKECLMSCVQSQLGDLSSVDAKELGEAVDMIKDLSEAIYYCTITKAMGESEKEEHNNKHYPPMDYNRYYPVEYRDMDRGNGRMYYPMGDYNSLEIRDPKEGRSPLTRRNYMENKALHKDKTMQMQELDKYMQELSHDITEMIEGASPEEKQMLQKKLSTLATKIV